MGARLLHTAVALALGMALVACGDKPQTATARKADVAPAKGGVSAYTAPGWKPGDATSWEQHLKKRSEGQNEYTRTGAPS
jgi:hypothetical protein